MMVENIHLPTCEQLWLAESCRSGEHLLYRHTYEEDSLNDTQPAPDHRPHDVPYVLLPGFVKVTSPFTIPLSYGRLSQQPPFVSILVYRDQHRGDVKLNP